MLNRPEFQNLDDKQKITAIVNLLNSNPITQLNITKPDAIENVIPPPKPTMTVNEETQRPLSDAERRRLAPRPDLRNPMTPEERERYSVYLRGENKITEMHNIPAKSRLFIGNLPLKNVSKEDLFRIFSPCLLYTSRCV